MSERATQSGGQHERVAPRVGSPTLEKTMRLRSAGRSLNCILGGVVMFGGEVLGISKVKRSRERVLRELECCC